ncbi:MAG: hypothetical protein WCY16_02925 [Weeksellaceae bacterium]
MNLIKRAQSPTPKFFRVLRTIGLVSAGIGGVFLTSPVELPVILVSIGGYLAVAGGVLSAVSQCAVDDSCVKETQQNESG